MFCYFIAFVGFKYKAKLMILTKFLHVFRLYAKWRCTKGCEAQLGALREGFNELIPKHLLESLDEKELEVMGHVCYVGICITYLCCAVICLYIIYNSFMMSLIIFKNEISK